MSTLKAHNIEPATGTDVALGAAGDSITISGDSLKLNTFKDAGANTVFTSDGSGTLSNVNSGLLGTGPILILSQTASNSASISFTSGITSTYDKYMFVWTDVNPATDQAEWQFQVNASGQSGYNEVITSAYWRSENTWTSASSGSIGYQTADDQAQGTGYQTIAHQCSNDADHSTSGILHLFSPSNTTYVTHFYSRSSHVTPDRAMDAFAAGYINVTAAITQIQFKMDSGNFDGVIQMYGIS